MQHRLEELQGEDLALGGNGVAVVLVAVLLLHGQLAQGAEQQEGIAVHDIRERGDAWRARHAWCTSSGSTTGAATHCNPRWCPRVSSTWRRCITAAGGNAQR